VAVAAGNRDNNVLGLYTSVNQTLDQSEYIQSTTVDNTLGASTPISQLLHQGVLRHQSLVKMWVVNRQNTAASSNVTGNRGDTPRSELQGVKSLFLNTHGKDQSVVGDNLAIVKDHILVVPINVSHSGIKHGDAGLEHQLLKFFVGVAGGLALEVCLL